MFCCRQTKEVQSYIGTMGLKNMQSNNKNFLSIILFQKLRENNISADIVDKVGYFLDIIASRFLIVY